MAMQVFQVPNQRNLIGVHVERPRVRPGMQTNPSQTYRDIESQIKGTRAFAMGVSNPQSIRTESVNIVRPGMNDEVQGMKVLGGMTCKYNGGRQAVSLLLVTPSKPGFRASRPAEFYAMKIPSHGKWNNAQEFTPSKKELDLVSDILPVFCDPWYEGARTEGLAAAQRKYGIPTRGVQPVLGTDPIGLQNMAADIAGNINVVPDRTPDRFPGVYSARELYYDGYYEEYERLSRQSDRYGEEYDEQDDPDDYRDDRDADTSEEERPTFRRPMAGEEFDYMQSFGIEREDDEDDYPYDEYGDDGYDDPYGSDNEEFHIDPDITSRWEDSQQRPTRKLGLMRILLIMALLIVLGIVGFIVFKVLMA